MRPKVGILTWHDPSNCGSTLQAYALHEYLCNQGIDAVIINYIPQWCRGDCMQMPWNTLSLKRKIKRIVKGIPIVCYNYLPECLLRRINPFFPFYNHFCKMTVACTENTIAEVCKSFTTIISGSDQIWNPNFLDPIFLQNFASEHTNKISYAASLGGKNLPEELVPLYKKHLLSFHAISVRENEGRDLLNSIGISSEVHVDPTLLLDAKYYRSISKPVSHIKKPFAFCYFLPTDREYKSQVQQYVQEHNLHAVGFSADKKDYYWMEEVHAMGPREFLWLIDNADMVFSNSYHATILSLIHHTPFFTFVRFAKNDTKCQNSRLEQLNSYFDTENYYVENRIPDRTIYPFSHFDEKLPALRMNAREYLLENIK